MWRLCLSEVNYWSWMSLMNVFNILNTWAPWIKVVAPKLKSNEITFLMSNTNNRNWDATPTYCQTKPNHEFSQVIMTLQIHKLRAALQNWLTLAPKILRIKLFKPK